jgi:hypothetical protein
LIGHFGCGESVMMTEADQRGHKMNGHLPCEIRESSCGTNVALRYGDPGIMSVIESYGKQLTNDHTGSNPNN